MSSTHDESVFLIPNPPVRPPGLPKEDAYRLMFTSIFTVINLTMVASGVQLFICGRAFLLYRQLPKDSESRKTKRTFMIILFLILFLFVSFSVCYSIHAGHALAEHPEGISHEQFAAVLAEVNALSTITSITSSFLPVIGDGVLLYRCFILYRLRPWLLTVPGVVYLALIGTVVASIVESSQRTFRGREADGLGMFVAISWPALSMATNLIATGYLLVPLLRMRFKLSQASPAQARVYTRIAAMLIESALPLALAAIATCAFRLSNTPLGVSTMMFPYVIWLILTALSPQIIIYRVIAGHTWTKYEHVSESEIMSHSIQFADAEGPPAEVSFDDDVEMGQSLVSPARNEMS